MNRLSWCIFFINFTKKRHEIVTIDKVTVTDAVPVSLVVTVNIFQTFLSSSTC